MGNQRDNLMPMTVANENPMIAAMTMAASIRRPCFVVVGFQLDDFFRETCPDVRQRRLNGGQYLLLASE
jgi:hypothetical protein